MYARRTVLTLLAALPVGALVGCGSRTTPEAETLDVAGFATLVKAPGVVVLDVRTPAEYAAGHLEGAINYDVEGPDFGRQISGLDKGVTYAVYCRSGNRSATALRLMKQVGITKAQHLGGGINAWTSAGHPVVR